MRLKRNAKVTTADGRDLGRVERVVVNPKSREVSHIVVRMGSLLTEDKVLPVEWIATAEGDDVRLRAEANDLEQLPPFEETHYVQAGEDGGGQDGSDDDARGYYFNPPLLAFRPLGYVDSATLAWSPGERLAETERNIPPESVALKEGATVKTSDDHAVGQVEQVVTAQSASRATHLVVTNGLLTKTRRLIPMDWVMAVTEDEVDLAVESGVIERMPPYEA